MKAPAIYRSTTEILSCTNRVGKQTLSVVVSDDANTIRIRTELEPDSAISKVVPPPGLDPTSRKFFEQATQKSWAETTMTSAGACPVPMKDGQYFALVKPDGTIVDPSQTTGCMVDVLKTVDGVTAPKTGFVWDPSSGPLPFVRYTYPRRNSHEPTDVTFTADSHFPDDPAKSQFVTTMSGLSTVNEGPDEFGADKIIELWKDRCGVAGNIFFP